MTNGSPSSFESSRSERCCDAFLIAYTVWTLLCHGVVYFRGTFHHLLGAAFVTLVAGIGFAWWQRKRRQSRVTTAWANVPEPWEAPSPDRSVVILGVVSAGMLTTLASLGMSYSWIWMGTVLVFVGALLSDRRPILDPGSPEPSLVRETVLWVIALAVAAIPLFVHRWSADDAYYVNIAVAAVDHPTSPILQFDTLHGIADLPIMYSVYKVNSFELLAAAIAFLTPCTALQATHLVLPALLALFFVFAHARWMKTLFSDRWFLALVSVLAVMIFVGDGKRHFANHTILRLQEGKTAFLIIVLPLLITHGVRFARFRNPRDWWMLTAGQIAAIGMTSTALWAAPLIAGLALLGAIPWTRSGVASLGLGVLSSAYVIVVALFLRADSVAELQTILTEESASTLVPDTWRLVMSGKLLSVTSLFAVLFGWAVVSGFARRFWLVLSLTITLTLLNPWAAPWVARNITGEVTYWRVFWVLPVPVLLGVTLISFWSWRAVPLAFRGALALACLVGFLIFIPETPTFSDANRKHLEFLGLKVAPREFEVAEQITQAVGPGNMVLTPVEVSTWITTLHHHPFPLVSRTMYLDIQARHLEPRDVERRHGLVALVSGAGSHPPTLLKKGIREYDLAAVCLRTGIPTAVALRRILHDQGFQKLDSDKRYETWIRSPRTGSSE